MLITGELPPGPGGIGAHAWALATGLSALGWEMHVVGPQDYVEGERTRAFAAAAPFPVTRLHSGGRRAVSAARRIHQARRAFKAHRPELVVTSGGAATVLWALVRVTGVGATSRTAVVIHGTELAFGGLRGLLYRRVLRSADSVVAVSEMVARRARPLRTEPVCVIHNGADPKRVLVPPGAGDSFRRRHQLGGGPLIVAVGSITERKGQHLLVDALPEIAASIPDVRFVCVGRPTEAASLRRQARALGVEDRLVVLGQVDDEEVAAAFAAADITTMTSTSTSDGDIEGYGIAITEGAFAQVPSVVSAGTGAAEAIVDGETGFAVDPAGIPAAVTRLLSDGRLCHQMGAAARRRALAESTWSIRVASYARLWGQILQPNLVVISHTEHWLDRDQGRTLAFGPTGREVNALAALFRTVRHVAPLHEGPPPASAAPTAPNVSHIPLSHAPGGTTGNRIRAIFQLPRWIATIAREVRQADVVHVRLPAGVAFAALPVLTVLRRPVPRWVKYAGPWQPDWRDPFVYRLQRAWIRSGLLRATATVNGHWTDQPAFVHPFDNPTLTQEDLIAGARAAANKDHSTPTTIVFVGRIEREKGADRAARLIIALRDRGHDVRGEFVGDGPLRAELDRLARALPDTIVLHGWCSRSALAEIYERSHLLLLPTTSEGFPKVVAEALAYGVVPVCTDLGAIGQVLRKTGGAVTLARSATDDEWLDALGALTDPSERSPLVVSGLAAAGRWTYDRYLDAVRAMFERDWDLVLTAGPPPSGTPPSTPA